MLQDQPAISASEHLSAEVSPSKPLPVSGAIRAFKHADIPQVCELFSRTFRLGKRYRADALAACLETTYFGPPAYTEETGSIVHVDEEGNIDGFMGVIPITMQLGDRVLRGGILSAYMAGEPDKNPRIGVSLVRGVTTRGFDLLFTDTANRTSLDIARATRFMILPSHSLEWVKIFKPSGTCLYFLGKRVPRLASWLAPLARVADAVYVRARPIAGPKRRETGSTASQAMAVRDFAEAAGAFMKRYALKPAWDRPSELAWFIDQAKLQTKYGPLQIREVLDRLGQRVGLYLLYARSGGVAYVLQILAKPNREELVVAQLITDAAELGAVAVRGNISPATSNGLFRQQGILYHHVMGTIAWARDPAIADALKSGNVLLGGLAGETWARIVTEDFS